MSGPVWVNFPVSATNIAQFNGAVYCDAFYTDDDKDRHALITVGRTIYEVFYSAKGIGTALLKTFHDDTTVGIAGFYSPNDKSRHAVSSSQGLPGNGAIYDLTYHPAQPNDGVIGYPISNGRVSAFYNPKSHNNHAIYLQANNTVSEVGWNWKNYSDPIHEFDLGSYPAFSAINEVAGFYTSDDKAKHAIVGCADGSIVELYWFTDYDDKLSNLIVDNRVPDIGQTIVAQIPGSVIAVAAFYVKGNQYSRRVVAATDQGVFEVAYDPAIGVRAAKLLVPDSAVLDIGGFYSPDDNQCHAILLLDGDGTTQIVQEVYYPA
ncbi:MAG: hypothetical protein ABSF17_00065 [Terracidiphilus sp.]|jgi:hypothetical protein